MVVGKMVVKKWFPPEADPPKAEIRIWLLKNG
jgi:hypothetical protein